MSTIMTALLKRSDFYGQVAAFKCPQLRIEPQPGRQAGQRILVEHWQSGGTAIRPGIQGSESGSARQRLTKGLDRGQHPDNLQQVDLRLDLNRILTGSHPGQLVKLGTFETGKRRARHRFDIFVPVEEFLDFLVRNVLGG